MLESQKESFLSINGFTFKGISRLEFFLCLRSFKFYSSLSLQRYFLSFLVVLSSERVCLVLVWFF